MPEYNPRVYPRSGELACDDIQNSIDLRDHFAGLAMQGMIDSAQGLEWPEDLAAMAYKAANAMLHERARHQPEWKTTNEEEK